MNHAMNYAMSNAQGHLTMLRKKFVALSNHALSRCGIWETSLAIYERRGRFQSITIKCGMSHSDIDAEIRSLGLPLSTFDEIGSGGHTMMETISR